MNLLREKTGRERVGRIAKWGAFALLAAAIVLDPMLHLIGESSGFALLAVCWLGLAVNSWALRRGRGWMIFEILMAAFMVFRSFQVAG